MNTTINKEITLSQLDTELETLAHTLLDSDFDTEMSKSIYEVMKSLVNIAKNSINESFKTIEE